MIKELKMRQTIIITDKTYKELQAYIDKHYGENRRVLSMVIEKALKEFLKREKNKR